MRGALCTSLEVLRQDVWHDVRVGVINRPQNAFIVASTLAASAWSMAPPDLGREKVAGSNGIAFSSLSCSSNRRQASREYDHGADNGKRSPVGCASDKACWRRNAPWTVLYESYSDAHHPTAEMQQVYTVMWHLDVGIRATKHHHLFTLVPSGVHVACHRHTALAISPSGQSFCAQSCTWHDEIIKRDDRSKATCSDHVHGDTVATSCHFPMSYRAMSTYNARLRVKALP